MQAAVQCPGWQHTLSGRNEGAASADAIKRQCCVETFEESCRRGELSSVGLPLLDPGNPLGVCTPRLGHTLREAGPIAPELRP